MVHLHLMAHPKVSDIILHSHAPILNSFSLHKRAHFMALSEILCVRAENPPFNLNAYKIHTGLDM